MQHRDWSLILRALGVVMLLAGIGVAMLAPIEMYTFYLFSAGGPFHYDGFGFGSFMFANIAAQIIAYYLIGFLLIPLGYGHLRLRRWARKLALTALGFWLVVGAVVSILFLLVLSSSKDPTLASVLFFAVLLALAYLLLPALMIRFYGGKDVKSTFEAHDPEAHWTDDQPVPILVLSLLSLFYAVCMHIPIFFSGIFPLFGTWIFDLPGIVSLTASMAILVCLAWGVLKMHRWAWWGIILYLAAMTLSSMLTLAQSQWSDILAGMRFAPSEMEIFEGLPIQGWHLAIVLAIPLLLTLGLAILSKRYFGEASPSQSPHPDAGPEQP